MKRKNERKAALMRSFFALAIICQNYALAVNWNSIEVNDIEYYVQIDKAIYSLGEEVNFLYRVTNLKDEEWRIEDFFPILDVVAEEIDGQNFNEIWNWSWDQFHPMGPIVFTLGPGESTELDEIWPQISLNGSVDPIDHTQVPPGLYRIAGVCYPADISIPVDITIVPEPSTLVIFITGLSVLITRKRVKHVYGINN